MIDPSTLKTGEVFVFTKVNGETNLYRDYKVGDELIFSAYNIKTGSADGLDAIFNFIVDGKIVSHFGYGIFDYIERKVLLERNDKLNQILQ